jgi:hypothetical protein
MLYATCAALIFVLVLAVAAKTHRLARLFRAQQKWAELMNRQNQATIYPKLEISSRLSFWEQQLLGPLGEAAQLKTFGDIAGEPMSEAKKITIGVLGGVLGIAAFFALVMMLVGKGDEPAPRPQPILAQQPKPVPPKLAPVQVQPQPLLGAQPPTERKTVSSAERITQVRSEASASKPDAQVADESAPPLVQGEARTATPAEQASASSARTEPTPEEHPSPPSVAGRAPSGDTASGTTATGIPTYVGPRGGVYHYSKSGKKVYERRR